MPVAADWPEYGGLPGEQRFSPLTQINTANISRLSLAWAADLPAVNNPVTAPIEVGGRIYISYGLSVVHAFDAGTGRELWSYDPGVGKVAGAKLRFGWGIRGLTWWNGIVITGTQDGRLIGIDARTGKLRWSVETTEENDGRYITGAPRVFDGKVIIGHGGADVAPIRGYVTAYDAATGKQVWRFYTVPGDPAQGFENSAMAMAAKTWTGEWWKYGGGGTAWNAITYDPALNRIYIGTGNGQPWNQKIRSPGGGDNLFLCSIVALDARTGTYLWHYQVNPGESWDYNAAMDITLADLEIKGKVRQVILQAPKNGFLYVIDRISGKLISAEKIVPHVTWASRIDTASGRPVEDPQARYPDGRAEVWPSAAGAHNWFPQSYSPATGLLYIPVMDSGGIYDDTMIDKAHWRATPSVLNPGVLFQPIMDARSQGASLLAWDPVRQAQAWSVRLPGYTNSGVLSTAGGLVFQGRIDGWFVAYDAASGKVLWRFDAGTGVMAPPVAFARGGVQYVSVIAGYGGGGGAMSPGAADFGWTYRDQPRRLLTFRLDGRAHLPATRRLATEPTLDAGAPRDAHGELVYATHCVLCHGMGARAGGSAPDLRNSAVVADETAFAAIVHDGMLVERGMPRFDELSESDLESLRRYVRRAATP
ncbi:PQQ-dependent dehydrogenase, methanol/ethanol family [Novosphingobium sp. PASSN1]|uniref:PQQ-dependent dehydrogenase, methanol/ethanol family n=1 Tax=Novosphingobium sp. PASSN1 TaxID=2015561 RepID=UPI0025F8D98B|nr:PQQ-dependent dehydrogenase, methanol/ethanol family [Novosphingobium sp. PASSN1]